MARVTLLTGGNLGNRQHNLEQAAKLISRQIGPVVLSSEIYESEPWGFEAEELFLNQALVVETTLSPTAVLDRIHAIERSLGRIRRENINTSQEQGNGISEVNAVSHLMAGTKQEPTAAACASKPEPKASTVHDLTETNSEKQTSMPVVTADGEHSTGSARIYHSRTIDIDILFYDNIRLNTRRLVIPHPRIGEREFVLRPLVEIMPEYIHPVTGHSIKYMWQQICKKNDQR